MKWPNLSPYGLRLQIERAADSDQTIAVITTAHGADGASHAWVLEALEFTPNETQSRWTRDAGIRPRELARAFPDMTMQEVDLADVLIAVPVATVADTQVPPPLETSESTAPDSDMEAETEDEDTEVVDRRASRIEDFGEHIGGAKKERWSRSRGIRFDDIASWTKEERATLLTKDRVWPKPDWKARLEAGADIGVLYHIKHIRDAVHAFPGRTVFGYSAGSRRRSRSLVPEPALEERYVEAVGQLADRLSEVKTRDEARAVFEGYIEEREIRRDGYVNRSRTPTEDCRALETCLNTRTRGNDIFRLFDGNDFNSYAAKATNADWPTPAKKIKRQTEARETPRKPLDHLERVGGADGLGRDATPQDFLDTFGFRGGEFGNWVSQAERQASLNHGYAALLDLAAVLDMPPRGISLGGSLAIAFGARGSGHAAAHYEPGRRVINLTKPSGAGALAHEWAHALDHFIGTETHNATDFRRPYASPFAATQDNRRRSDIGREVVNAVDAFSSRMVRRVSTLDELMQTAHERRNSYVSNAGAWAGWMLGTAKHHLFNSARAGKVGLTADDMDRLRAEIAASGPIRRLEALADEVKTAGAWTASSPAAAALAADMEMAFVGVVGGQRERKGVLNAGRAIRAVGTFPEFSELAAAWASPVNRPARPTRYLADSKAWDAGRSKSNLYYSTPWEMFARGFETCVNDALEARGWQNDYLVHSTRYDAWEGHAKGSPYPVGEDLDALREAFVTLSKEVSTFVSLSAEARTSAPSESVPNRRAASLGR